jgi:hypothetical protein
MEGLEQRKAGCAEFHSILMASGGELRKAVKVQKRVPHGHPESHDRHLAQCSSSEWLRSCGVRPTRFVVCVSLRPGLGRADGCPAHTPLPQNLRAGNSSPIAPRASEHLALPSTFYGLDLQTPDLMLLVPPEGCKAMTPSHSDEIASDRPQGSQLVSKLRGPGPPAKCQLLAYLKLLKMLSAFFGNQSCGSCEQGLRGCGFHCLCV